MPLNLEAAAVADVDAHVAEVKAVFPAGLNRIARAGAAAGGTPEGLHCPGPKHLRRPIRAATLLGA